VGFTPTDFYDYLGVVASIYQVITTITDPYWRLHFLCENRNRVMLLCINKNCFSVGGSRVSSKKCHNFYPKIPI